MILKRGKRDLQNYRICFIQSSIWKRKKLKLLFSRIFRTEENRASSRNLRHSIFKNLEVPSPLVQNFNPLNRFGLIGLEDYRLAATEFHLHPLRTLRLEAKIHSFFLVAVDYDSLLSDVFVHGVMTHVCAEREKRVKHAPMKQSFSQRRCPDKNGTTTTVFAISFPQGVATHYRWHILMKGDRLRQYETQTEREGGREKRGGGGDGMEVHLFEVKVLRRRSG